MTVSELRATVRVGTWSADVTDLVVELDESAAPYARADFVVPLTPDVLDVLEPRTSPPPRVQIRVMQRFTGSVPLAEMSADHAGMTLADVSALWAGETLAGITGAYARPWNATTRPTLTRTLTLSLRARTPDYAAGTVRVIATSDEQRLVDYGLMETSSVTPGSSTVLSAVQLALARAIPSAVLVTTHGGQTVTADALVWEPGISAWSYLEPITASAGLRLWCDELGAWHLEPPETIITPGTAVLASTGTVLDIEEDVSREDGPWHDGVVVTYEWTDGSGVRRVQHDTAGDNATRVLRVVHDRPYPGPGEAAARLRKARGGGRVMTVRAVLDPSVTPAQAASITPPGIPSQSGWVAAVRWDVAAAEMTVRTRDLIDVPATAYLFGPPGYRYYDVPAGTSYTTFTWPQEVA